ncbi:MAG: thioesterase family protein [Acidimicrobiia bacterium]
MALRPGLAAKVTHKVTEDDTALEVGSGDVDVLATPILVLICERAAVAATDGNLEPGTTTVGHRVQVDHLSPTPIGGIVTAEATLELVEGRRLTFRVAVNDGRGLVAAGRVTRVVVDRERFLQRVANSD